MPIITKKTQLQSDLAAKDAQVLQCAEAAHNLAAVMRNAHRWLWDLPDDRLLAILNADAAVTSDTFAQNTALGLAVNAALDALDMPEFPGRAPVTQGRSDLSVVKGRFVIVPPVAEPPVETPAGPPTN